jgi:hypothetical protein
MAGIRQKEEPQLGRACASPRRASSPGHGAEAASGPGTECLDSSRGGLSSGCSRLTTTCTVCRSWPYRSVQVS